MFTEEAPSYSGKHFRIEGALNNPRPIRGDIPIMVGGSGERKTLRLVAQYADACNVFGDREQVRHLMDVLHRHCEAVGRDPREITKTRLGTLAVARTHEEAEGKVEILRQQTLMPERIAGVTRGDPDSVAEQARAFLDAGLNGLIFNMPDAEDPEAVALAGAALRPVVGR